METTKQNFSIKDLEYLSGVKAHTIRMWEKRYKVLAPVRSETNIRSYDLSCLQKILNVSFLSDYGYKISKIAKFSGERIAILVKEVAQGDSLHAKAINAFKISMINFDVSVFNKTYENLSRDLTFQSICHNYFLPLLDNMGFLCQDKMINPAHEQFLTGLIRQKLYLNIAILENEIIYQGDEWFILFLPENEIHDIGLLFLNFELQSLQRHTIYLGPSLPLSNMKYLLEIHPKLKFVSYLTHTQGELSKFLLEFEKVLCQESKRELNLFGSQLHFRDLSHLPSNIKVYKSIPEFSNSL